MTGTLAQLDVRAVEQFLYREAKFADEHDYDGWKSLWTDDGVVSNAGILRDASFQKLTAADWDAVHQVHLYGGFYGLHSAWPHFREQRHGRIVVATSTSGTYGNFGQANYGAAKGGLIGLINTLAIEGRRTTSGPMQLRLWPRPG